MPGPVPFKVFGLQRTCTNLTVHLLTKNYRVVPTESGGQWKHGCVRHFPWQQDGEPVRVIICVKHPLAWLDSFYRWCKGNALPDGRFNDGGLIKAKFIPTMSFAGFLRMPCYEHATPIDRWNAMNQHWLGLSADPQAVQIVRSEEYYDIAGQRRVLRRLERAFGLERSRERILGQHRRVSANGRVKRVPMAFDYYTQEHYLESYSPFLLQFVRERVDLQLLEQLRYTLPATVRPEIVSDRLGFDPSG